MLEWKLRMQRQSLSSCLSRILCSPSVSPFNDILLKQIKPFVSFEIKGREDKKQGNSVLCSTGKYLLDGSSNENSASQQGRVGRGRENKFILNR
jgi:hypothetical protein